MHCEYRSTCASAFAGLPELPPVADDGGVAVLVDPTLATPGVAELPPHAARPRTPTAAMADTVRILGGPPLRLLPDVLMASRCATPGATALFFVSRVFADWVM